MSILLTKLLSKILTKVVSMTFKKLRKLKGYKKQSELAKELSISRTTISMWETGESYPTLPTIYKIAKLFSEKPEMIFLCFEVKGVM